VVTEIDGIIYTNETRAPWTEWNKCFVAKKKKSITGEMIWGFIWVRECDGMYEDPKNLGWYYVPGKEYAKTRKEIFMQNLKGSK